MRARFCVTILYFGFCVLFFVNNLCLLDKCWTTGSILYSYCEEERFFDGFLN